jgi:hypothetical protein
MDRFRFLADRTAVLFLGVAAGTAIGWSFGAHDGGGERRAPAPVIAAPEAAPVQAPPSEAPPPPAGPAAPATEPDAKATETPEAVAKPTTIATPVEAPPTVDQPAGDLAAAAHNGRPIRVGVFGDSFGDGVWSALYRLLPAKDGYQVSKFSQQSTGFTRYRSLNLESHDDSQIGSQPIDVAVVSFGANDRQGVCDAGHCGQLMGSYWQQVIGQRIESYVAMLRRHGATVYWVGLPAMRDSGFDSDATSMDAFYAATMRRLGVPFIEIRPYTVDGSGQYEAYYQDADGTAKLLRAGDGVHMSMNGYIRISKGLAGRIRATVDAARRQNASAPADDQAGTGAS